jgi:hypothetical protein
MKMKKFSKYEFLIITINFILIYTPFTKAQTSCNPGYYLNSGQCVMCPASTYSSITGATSSSSCTPYYWLQRGTDIDGEASVDNSGNSVSISSNGTVVAIGAYQNDGNGANSGNVRVYEWNGTAWIQRGIDIDGEASSDQSGWSVSLSSDGTVVAIGANLNDGSFSNAGQVRVYRWNGTSWVKLGSDIDGEATNDQSGYSVSLSSNGTVVAIGAIFNDGTVANSDRGQVRVYQWNGNAWVQRGTDIDGETAGDQSGISVSLSADGTMVAIGARYNDGTVAGLKRSLHLF